MIALLLGLLVLSPVAYIGYKRYEFQTRDYKQIFVKLLPIRGLTLKVAYMVEGTTRWKVSVFSVQSVLSSQFRDLEFVKSNILHLEEGLENSKVVVLRFRTEWEQFYDRLIGKVYPTISDGTLKALDFDLPAAKREAQSSNTTELTEKIQKLVKTLEAAGVK